MPSVNPAFFQERIHGNQGNDYAMIDWADGKGTGVAVEKIETLPALTF
jgi:hypothetical protein